MSECKKTTADILVADDYIVFEKKDDNADRFLDTLNKESQARIRGFSGYKDVGARISGFSRRTIIWPHIEIDKSYYFRFQTRDMHTPVVVRGAALGIIDEILLGPDMFSDGEILTSWWINDQADHIAYAVSLNGSDTEEIRIKNLITGEILPETLTDIRFGSVAWLKDGAEFLYNRHNPLGKNGDVAGLTQFGILKHRLGTDQEADESILDFTEQTDTIAVPYREVGSDNVYVSLYKGSDPKNGLMFAHASSGRSWTNIVDSGVGWFSVVGERQLKGTGEIILSTDLDCSNGKIVSWRETEPGAFRALIDEFSAPLISTEYALDHLYVVLHNGTGHRIECWNLEGSKPRSIEIYEEMSVGLYKSSANSDSVFALVETPVSPNEVWEIAGSTGKATRCCDDNDAFETLEIESERHDIPMPDGVEVPLSIICKKGNTPTSDTPMLLYTYGGFGATLSPCYDPFISAFVEMGGAYAVAHIRGGGEKGSAWHEAAVGLNKGKSIDDFLACAHYLVSSGKTSRERLAFHGQSNGGLIVLASLMLEPDACCAVISDVPVTDMLRYHTHYAGKAWISEYGSPDDPETKKYVASYSPLHNVRHTQYPPVLITTSSSDDRVVPWHAHKMAAALIHKSATPENVFLISEKGGGHYGPENRLEMIEADSIRLSFVAHYLELGKHE